MVVLEISSSFFGERGKGNLTMAASFSHRTLALDGSRVHYVEAGQGMPVIVLHGMMCSWQDWEYLAAILSTHHRVIIPDLPGFGQSSPFLSNFDLIHYVTFVKKFATALNLSQYVLIGGSMGATIAFLSAVSNESVIKVILINLPVVLTGFWTRIGYLLSWGMLNLPGAMFFADKLRHSQRFIKLVFKLIRVGDTKLTVGIQQADLHTTARLLNDVLHYDLQKSPALISAPLLFCTGTQDPFVQLSILRSFIKRYPRVETFFIEGGGHCLNSAEIDPLIPKILDFIKP